MRDRRDLNVDAWSPPEIARRVESLGVAKARGSVQDVLVLGVLAGAFISLGALAYTVVVSGSTLGFGPTRALGGLAFCLGLVLVILAGAELFTGNNLVVMAWASKRITSRELLRNWGLAYLGNVLGALATVGLVVLAGTHTMGGGEVGEKALAIGWAKAELGVLAAFARATLCNALVCLAVWLAMGGHTLTDKLLAVLFPVAAFVLLGFEHSIANWFFLPYALVLADGGGELVAGAVRNLVVVTVGNVCGGSLLVACVYWTVYLRGAEPRS
ncbi:MAG: formate/nitrite transporter family protein [bacterium]|nr:formate/nitrite transporter family protein [bacterium]